jgi:hypothetical protein
MRLGATVFSLLIATASPASQPVTLDGRVLIQNNGPRTVLAFIEPGTEGITHVLRLTAEETLPQNPTSFYFEDGHVELLEDRFVITSAAQRMSVIFAVTTVPLDREKRGPIASVHPEIAEPAAAPLHHALLLRGYWLSSRTVEGGRPIATVRRPGRIAALFCDAPTPAIHARTWEERVLRAPGPLPRATPAVRARSPARAVRARRGAR